MRQVAGRLRLELAQFRELEAFAQFGAADLDKSARQQIERGRRIIEVLKQPQYSPMSLGHQVLIIYAVTNGFLDDVPLNQVSSWETDLHDFVSTSRPELLAAIEREEELLPEIEALLQTVLLEYKAGGS
jgi:F-type H+-transporting ATPase subunit alpha